MGRRDQMSLRAANAAAPSKTLSETFEDEPTADVTEPDLVSEKLSEQPAEEPPEEKQPKEEQAEEEQAAEPPLQELEEQSAEPTLRDLTQTAQELQQAALDLKDVARLLEHRAQEFLIQAERVLGRR